MKCLRPGCDCEEVVELGTVRDLFGEDCGLDPSMRIVECKECGLRMYVVDGRGAEVVR